MKIVTSCNLPVLNSIYNTNHFSKTIMQKQNIIHFIFLLLIHLSSNHTSSQHILLPDIQLNPVYSLNISKDSKFLLIGSEHYFQVLDIETSLVIKEYIKDWNKYQAIDISPDNKYTVTCWENEAAIVVRDIETDSLIRKISLDQNEIITSVRFSPRSKYIISRDVNNEFKLWRFTTGELATVFKNHTLGSADLSFSGNRRYIISAGADRMLKLWDTKSQKFTRKFKGLSSGIYYHVQFIANDSRVLSIGIDNMVRIWDIASEKQLKAIRLPFEIKSHFHFSANGKYVAQVTDSTSIIVYDLLNREEYITIDNHPWSITEFCFSVDNRHIFFADKSMEIKMVDFQNGIMEKIFSNTINYKTNVRVSPDSKLLLSAGRDPGIMLWNLQRAKPVCFFDGHRDTVSLTVSADSALIYRNLNDSTKIFRLPGKVAYKPGACFLPNNNTFITVKSNPVRIELQNTDSHEPIKSFKSSLREVYCVDISPNGKYIIAGGYGKHPVQLWNMDRNMRRNFAIPRYSVVNAVCFGKSSEIAFTGASDNNIYIWQIPSGKLLKTLEGHKDNVSSVNLTNQDKYLFSGSWDGTTKMWDISTGKEIASFVVFAGSNAVHDNNFYVSEDYIDFNYPENTDWIIVTPQKYYTGSLLAAENCGFRNEMKAFTYKQFRLKYYRPDLVLSQIPVSDKSLIPVYFKTYKNRMQRLGFSEDLPCDFHTPDISVLNSKRFPENTTIGNIALTIKAYDAKYTLDRILVRVNNVPVFGRNGINVKQKNTKKIQQEIPVQLSYGNNKIEISAINSIGTESPVSTVNMQYMPESFEKPDLYIITIGISEFADSSLNLEFAAKDAHDLSGLWQQPAIRRSFRNVYAINLHDKEANRNNILKIKEMLQKTNPDDMVILYVNTYGLFTRDFDYYYASFDINISEPGKNGLHFDDLGQLLDSIPARKKLLISDIHLALAYDTEINSSKNNMQVGVRYCKNNYSQPAVICRKNAYELLKELYADLHNETGTIVVATAACGEYSFNSQNGIMTHCIINGIATRKADANKDRKTVVSELRNYTINMVEELTQGKQKEAVPKNNVEFDFWIW